MIILSFTGRYLHHSKSPKCTAVQSEVNPCISLLTCIIDYHSCCEDKIDNCTSYTNKEDMEKDQSTNASASQLPSMPTSTQTPTATTSQLPSMPTSTQRPTATSSHSASPSPTSGTNERTSDGSSTVAIVCGVIGSLIVVILAALLVIQLIRMFQRRKYRHHPISGEEKSSVLNVKLLHPTNRNK